MFFSTRNSEAVVDKDDDRREYVDYQAAENQVNSYLDTVLIDGYLEGTNKKKSGSGILMKDVPDI